tara:strand:+ start:502 stop:1029 length:528 start_codon:yes stop_codon:yes gene_type:complete
MHRKTQIIKILIFFLIFNGVSNAQNIAFIDMEIILKNSKIGISINEQIDKKTKNGQKNLKQMEEDIRKKDSQLNAQKNILSEEEFKKKLKLLNTDLQNYQRSVQENRNIINNYKISATSKLLKNLKPILAEYSIEKNISVIFQKKDLIIAKNSLNITDDIIKILNKKVTKINLDE